MKKGDIIIFASLVLILIGSFLWFNPFNKVSSNLTAVIRVDGELYRSYKLTKNYENIVEINTKFGYNKLQINGLKIRMIETSCEDRLDVKLGYIEKPYQSIICLPNRVVVSLEGDTDIDYVSY